MQRSLTEGGIAKSLIIFSLPMILGNLLQQLYNVADTLIVGQTIGTTALSAVGSSYSLMTLLTSVILGLCMGSGVVFAQFYGAKREDDMKSSIFNACIFILLVSAVINILAFLLLDQFIIWLNIPEQAVEYTREYLQVIFVGITFVSAYNFFACILQQRGQYGGTPDLPGGFRHYQYCPRHCFYRQLSHGGSRGCLGYRHRPGSLRHLCGRLLLRQGKTVMSTTAASSSQQAAAGLCHQQLHPDRHSAVHYESWYLDGTGVGQQLWLFCQRRLRRRGQN